jgi:hypothetical protein
MGIENRLKQLRVFKRIGLLPFTMHTNQTLQASTPLIGTLQNVSVYRVPEHRSCNGIFRAGAGYRKAAMLRDTMKGTLSTCSYV